MTIIDIGEAFYIASEIAYISKSTDDITDKPIIKIFLKGNPATFTASFTSIEQRDKCYEEWKNLVINNKD